ncbi:MAG: acetyltransferase [Nitrososphaera sp.]|nr:acetyltransferase [Nitrososphaera sp.]
MKPLIIFGATELARLACYFAKEAGMQPVALAVDEQFKTKKPSILPVLSWSETLEQFPPSDAAAFVAVGYKTMRMREVVYSRVKSCGYELANILCPPSGCIASDVSMGDNTFIMPGVVIEPGVKLGCNNVIWSNSSICHDTIVGNHNFIAAHVTLGGGVRIGDRSFLGFSSVVFQHRQIGSDSLIAAGALVTRNLEGLCEYRGSPAKRYRHIDPEEGVCVK